MGAASALERYYWESIVGADRESAGAPLRGLNALFGDHIQRLLRASGGEPPLEIFAGAYPLHTVNALVVPHSGGALVLVNEGLLRVATAVASALAAGVPASYGGEEEPAQFPEWQVDALIASAVSSIFSGSRPQSPELTSEPRRAFARFLTDGLVGYVLSHEIAHVLLGHVAVARETVSRSGRAVPISLPSWAQELRADEAGWKLLAAELGSRISLESTFLPPTLFFEILENEWAVRSAGAPQGPARLEHVADIASHPRAALRRCALITSTNPDGPLARMSQVDYLIECMARARGEAPFTPDSQAVTDLQRLAEGCDPATVDNLLGLGSAVDGLTEVEVAAVAEFVAADHDRARAVVASAALATVAIGRATRELPLMHLGLLMALYEGTYGEAGRRHPQASETWSLVRRTAPDVDAAVLETGRTVLGQHPEE
jgi:hypothetical protein